MIGGSSHSSVITSINDALRLTGAAEVDRYLSSTIDDHHQSSSSSSIDSIDRIKQLYPFVDEKKTPLPRCWNNADKYALINISNDNLRVTYRGAGKNHKDAAAVRANHSIPAACGLYYFEVTIVSKGRDGYMGIGLCEKDVSLNRLPGWDRNSYGYHGDDGNFFSSSGNGTPYGPTFTTNDVVGCGFNLVDNTIFYTKNGQNLGVAISNIPNMDELYPTVGLQTPGEIVDTNFGQLPFRYQIQDDIKEAQMRVHAMILAYELPMQKIDWMNKLVSSYLAHHGYCATVESFNKATNLPTIEDATSMINRQEIQKLVLKGEIARAIEIVDQFYPNLFAANKPLLFALKIRQFIEMLGAISQNETTDSSQQQHIPRSTSRQSSPAVSPPYNPFKRRSTADREHRRSPRRSVNRVVPAAAAAQNDNNPTTSSSSLMMVSNGSSHHHQHDEPMDIGATSSLSISFGLASSSPNAATVLASHPYTNGSTAVNSTENGSTSNNSVANGSASVSMMPPIVVENDSDSDDMPFDGIAQSTSTTGPTSSSSFEKYNDLLAFGRSVNALSQELSSLPQHSSLIQQMNDAFSMLCYEKPRESMRGYLLDSNQRTSVAKALNSAILESQGQRSSPPLELVLKHARYLRQQLASAGIGSAPFVDPNRLVFERNSMDL